MNNSSTIRPLPGLDTHLFPSLLPTYESISAPPVDCHVTTTVTLSRFLSDQFAPLLPDDKLYAVLSSIDIYWRIYDPEDDYSVALYVFIDDTPRAAWDFKSLFEAIEMCSNASNSLRQICGYRLPFTVITRLMAGCYYLYLKAYPSCAESSDSPYHKICYSCSAHSTHESDTDMSKMGLHISMLSLIYRYNRMDFRFTSTLCQAQYAIPILSTVATDIATYPPARAVVTSAGNFGLAQLFVHMQLHVDNHALDTVTPPTIDQYYSHPPDDPSLGAVYNAATMLGLPIPVGNLKHMPLAFMSGPQYPPYRSPTIPELLANWSKLTPPERTMCTRWFTYKLIYPVEDSEPPFHAQMGNENVLPVPPALETPVPLRS